MRKTIKKHSDFMMPDDGPVARSPYFLIRAGATRFPDGARFGITATKRTFRHAVDRNRAKRKLRDWIRFNDKYLLDNLDYVFIARGAIIDATRPDGRASMGRALRYIKREYGPKKQKS